MSSIIDVGIKYAFNEITKISGVEIERKKNTLNNEKYNCIYDIEGGLLFLFRGRNENFKSFKTYIRKPLKTKKYLPLLYDLKCKCNNLQNKKYLNHLWKKYQCIYIFKFNNVQHSKLNDIFKKLKLNIHKYSEEEILELLFKNGYQLMVDTKELFVDKEENTNCIYINYIEKAQVMDIKKQIEYLKSEGKLICEMINRGEKYCCDMNKKLTRFCNNRSYTDKRAFNQIKSYLENYDYHNSIYPNSFKDGYQKCEILDNLKNNVNDIHKNGNEDDKKFMNILTQLINILNYEYHKNEVLEI
jgi:hypothetical protein